MPPIDMQTSVGLFAAVYLRATGLAGKNNQVVGEKHDLYLTLEQLMEILRDVAAEGRMYANR
jgi:hypothetical protein